MTRWLPRALVLATGLALTIGGMTLAGMRPFVVGLVAIGIAVALAVWVVGDVITTAATTRWMPPFLPAPHRPVDARVARLQRLAVGAPQGGPPAAALRAVLGSVVARRSGGGLVATNPPEGIDPSIAAELFPLDPGAPLTPGQLGSLLDRIERG